MHLFMLGVLVSCGDQGDTSNTDDSVQDDTDQGGDDDTGTLCELANPPTGLLLSGSALPLQAPSAEWTTPSQGCADTDHYQLALGHMSADDVLAWTRTDTADWDGVVSETLPDAMDLTLSVRAVDTLGNVSDVIDSQSFQRWSPQALSGVVSWYDWSDQASVGCGEAVALGEEFGCMADSSGNGNALSVHNSGKSEFPMPVLSELNGLQAADFHDTRRLAVADNSSISITGSELLIAVVESPTSLDDYGSSISKFESYELYHFDAKLYARVRTDSDGLASLGGGTVDPGMSTGPQLNVFMFDGSTWTLRRDGIELGVMAAPDGQTGSIVDSDSPLVIGGNALGAKPYQAIQGEILLLSALPSDSELADLEGHLMQKWGL